MNIKMLGQRWESSEKILMLGQRWKCLKNNIKCLVNVGNIWEINIKMLGQRWEYLGNEY